MRRSDGKGPAVPNDLGAARGYDLMGPTRRESPATTALKGSQTTGGPSSNAGQMVAWVVLLFALTIIGALPMLLQGLNLARISPSTPHLPLVMMGMLVTSCSPTLAALLVVGLYPRAGGLRSLSRQVRTWRVKSIWYVIALIGPILLLLAAKAINAARLGTRPDPWLLLSSLSGPSGLPFIIFGSLFAEEPGWRGFAQPRLQTRCGALLASVFIGFLWSAWHLWYVILPGGLSNVSGTDAVATLVRLTSTAVIYAWMYNSTGSLFIAMIAHLGHNLAASLIPTPADGGQQHLVTALLYFVVAMILVFTTEPRTLRVRPSKR